MPLDKFIQRQEEYKKDKQSNKGKSMLNKNKKMIIKQNLRKPTERCFVRLPGKAINTHALSSSFNKKPIHKSKFDSVHPISHLKNTSRHTEDY